MSGLRCKIKNYTLCLMNWRTVSKTPKKMAPPVATHKVRGITPNKRIHTVDATLYKSNQQTELFRLLLVGSVAENLKHRCKRFEALYFCLRIESSTAFSPVKQNYFL